MDYEVIIIGGGVVGLSCAMFLSQKFSTLLVEQHPSFGRETSSRNSEVVHSGIYYPKDSLKAKLCVEGNKSLYRWCEENNVSFKKTGKVIVATNEQEIEYLEKLLENAKRNGLDGVESLDASQVRRLEPNIKAIAGLLVKATGIVDSHRLMESLYAKATSNGCSFAFNHKVVAIEPKGETYVISVQSKDGEKFNVSSKIVVNSAGLESDTICSLLGLDVDKLGYKLRWAKGHYFRVRHSKSNLVSRLVYPVPPKNANFLGIHITIELNGGLKLGPDLVYLDEKVKDYSVPEDLRQKFYDSVSTYLIGLEVEDLFPDQAGIRPKLAYFNNYPDFIIKDEKENGFPGFINLVGIESPGLTCALEIGKMVYDLANG
ncbi:NAD(P)/FAD-dependent oxidoreductase [Bacteroidetes/Chlorobi group bacterium Naka2016]|nr:MAG: NAD(P)/FAD-dependent oxidoreductase [Bacteroidetes/Chlorobi group bacterium Naka2016]